MGRHQLLLVAFGGCFSFILGIAGLALATRGSAAEPVPPDRERVGAGAGLVDEPCYWVLLVIGDGWQGDGRNWNLAQVILRATAKARTEDELWRYAELLHLALGATRSSDGTFAKASRAL